MFSFNISLVVIYAKQFGLNAAYDDVKARDGHMRNSLHYDGLAADLVLYDEHWNYITETEGYRKLGEFWEGLHENCYWGGRTRRDEEGTALTRDGNHFSMSWDRRR